MTAEYKVHGSVAVITLNNPPVNGLGYETRKGITDGLERANADAAVKAIVITGAGKAFSGGADIREFGTPKALQEPNLLSVILAVERSDKPVVAAVHSVCMGGGLELALGCHYRMAAPGCNVALPEVKLGLIPGAGGTQRLPRVLGVEPALNMIVSGEPVKSEMPAQLPGQKLFDKLAARQRRSPPRRWRLPRRSARDMPTAARCRWCATCRASTRRARRTSSSRATWSRAWPRACPHRSSASMPWKRRRPGSSTTACASSARSSST